MSLFLKSISELFDRDISKLEAEIAAYPNEESLWLVDGTIKNCGGNLAWHLIGNLNHFFGATLGNSGYVRDRPGEFNDRDIPKAKLLEELSKAKVLVANVLDSLDENHLSATYPIEVFGKPMTTLFFITHLHSHLNYHRGQINYHRRLLANE